MKKVLVIIVLGFAFIGSAFAEKTEDEKQNDTEAFKKLWLDINSCWYGIDQKMTDFANQLIDRKKIGRYESHQLRFWKGVSGEVLIKFPKYDYSECKQDNPEMYAQKWVKKNKWFQANKEMTEYAFKIHRELTRQGVDAIEDHKFYYGEIDRKVRLKFPDYNWSWIDKN